jgi:hypothetical protein
MKGADTFEVQQRKAGGAHFKSTRLNLCDFSTDSLRANIQLLKYLESAVRRLRGPSRNPENDHALLFHNSGQAVGGVLTPRRSAAREALQNTTTGRHDQRE